MIPKHHDTIPSMADFSRILGHNKYFILPSNIMHDAIHDLYLRSNTPKIGHLFVNGKHIIMIHDIQLIQRIFNRQKSLNLFEKDTNIFEIYQEILSDGIITAHSTQYQFHKKLLNNAINSNIFMNYAIEYCIQTVDKCMKHNIFKSETLKTDRNGYTEIEITSFLSAFTLDLYLQIIFNKTFNLIHLFPKQHIFSRAYYYIIKYMNKRDNDPLWKLKRSLHCGYERELKRYIHTFNTFIKTLIENAANEENTLLYLYQHSDKHLSNKQIRDNAMNILFFGTEKTKWLISWCLYELCRNLNIKEILIESMDKYKGNEYINAKNTYLDSCLLETMRLHPLIPMITRRSMYDIDIGNGYVINENDYIFVHLWTLCRDKRHYSNPFQFRPQRWIKNKDKIGFKLFFNVGWSACLGKDLGLVFAKIFLFNFVKNYEFELAPQQEIKYCSGFLLKMNSEMYLRIRRRV